jgi:hypothetical protein
MGFLSVLLLMQAVSTHVGLSPAHAWFDETHIAVAKAAGYAKWFNVCGPDMIKVKMGEREANNHYANNPRGRVIAPEMVMAQVASFHGLGIQAGG